MNLNVEILRVLDGTNGSYPEPALLHELRMTLPPTITTAEFDSAIRGLQDKRYITGIKPELGGEMRWKITDEGKGALNSALR
ncbi:MAG TPA: hypothetical protein VK615_01290 [Candidatus Binatia bacterium]|nr:hypothetical protein [Candidatus Binatia bacterium]